MRALLSASLVTSALCLAAGDASFAKLVQQIGGAVDSDRAMQTMRRVWETDRWFAFPKFRETAEYLKATMTAAGLRDVELIEAPADGVTRVGFWTMPLAWDVKQARVEIVGPAPGPEFRVLADYQAMPASLGMWSGPTPPDGVTAEVIELQRAADLERLDVKGKLVLTAQDPSGMKWMLARKGALGAINAFTENRELRDGRQWINAWGDYGWAFIKSSRRLLCFSISTGHGAARRQRGPG